MRRAYTELLSEVGMDIGKFADLSIGGFPHTFARSFEHYSSYLLQGCYVFFLYKIGDAQVMFIFYISVIYLIPHSIVDEFGASSFPTVHISNDFGYLPGT